MQPLEFVFCNLQAWRVKYFWGIAMNAGGLDTVERMLSYVSATKFVDAVTGNREVYSVKMVRVAAPLTVQMYPLGTRQGYLHLLQ